MITIAHYHEESNPLQKIRTVLDEHTRCLSPGDSVAAVNFAIELRNFLRDQFDELSLDELAMVRDAAGVVVDAATARAEEIETDDAGTADCPEVEAALKRGKCVNLWIVGRCPFCGCQHQHGAGLVGDDPRALLGHRLSHCAAGGGRGYVLVSAHAEGK